MNQEEIGKFIKELRKKNNLTQKEFAEKYNITYQAVSKWENGKNMPDTSLLKQISKDYNISMEEILEGKYKEKKKKKTYIVIIAILILISALLVIIIKNRENDFEFKTITTTCNDFNITGTIAYSNKKSAIYITNITYCGENDDELYDSIECSLYETNNNILQKISSYKHEGKISLEEFLKKVSLKTDDYSRICKKYNEDNLYLLIDAVKEENTTTYKIPLKIEECN